MTFDGQSYFRVDVSPIQGRTFEIVVCATENLSTEMSIFGSRGGNDKGLLLQRYQSQWRTQIDGTWKQWVNFALNIWHTASISLRDFWVDGIKEASFNATYNCDVPIQIGWGNNNGSNHGAGFIGKFDGFKVFDNDVLTHHYVCFGENKIIDLITLNTYTNLGTGTATTSTEPK